MFARRFRCEAVTYCLSEVESFSDPSRQWIFHCRGRSGSGCVSCFGVLDCRVRRHFPELRGAPTRSRVLLPEHIAILQSAASSGPRSARRSESRPASRCRFPRCENGSVFLRVPIENQTLCSGLAFHSLQTLVLRRSASGEPKRGGFRRSRNLLII